MNTYTHYGVEVTRQIIDKAFKSVLKKKQDANIRSWQ